MHRILTSICLALAASAVSAQTIEDLTTLQGPYLFQGTTPFCEVRQLMPNYYYDCYITAQADNLLYLTGFVGQVDNEEHPHYIGQYDAETQSITFTCGPENDGENIYDADHNRYFIYDFTLKVGTDEAGRTTLSQTTPFWFYAQQDGKWFRASYEGLKFTKDGERSVWNGNTNHPTSARTLDDLLHYSVNFEMASEIAVSGYDLMGLIYDEEGALYALAVINAKAEVIGSFEVKNSWAIVDFKRLCDFTSDTNTDILNRVFPTRPATPGCATVVFCPRGFVIDGTLVEDEIVNYVTLEHLEEAE